MRRHEKLSVAAASLLAVAALSFIAIRALPVMPVEDIRVSGIPRTASITRMLANAEGTFLPSLDRSGMIRALEDLAYVDQASISYNGGTLSVDIVPSDGAVLLTAEEAYFFDGDGIVGIAMEDAGSLYGVYPMAAVDPGMDEALSIASALASLPSDAVSLITWSESVNNNGEGNPILSLYLQPLNASIDVMEETALQRLEESIGLIRADASRGCIAFSSPVGYELYHDRLMRVRG